MTGPKTNYTLEKLKDVLQEASFPKEKTYFKFYCNPTPINESTSICVSNFEVMCTQPQIGSDWCTRQSYNEKGQYVQKNGAGFMVCHIDIDHPHNCCNCEKPYPVRSMLFWMVLMVFHQKTVNYLINIKK
ncbi:uncharacterized protein LOC132917442 [Rhopalosiphum padi]|uniref:uncharacterized protein LOC132917442 n=1 Tax=Rhopalosiphum padi TaxID=40932 RepID=UPI00298E352B|nr:uncharacterized protein LOC132917442 [Rhopalosiphum padi]